MTTAIANWNGEEMPLEEVRVPALDRGFLFGDGVYEVLRQVDGKLFRAREHLDRLRYSLGQLRIGADVDVIESRAMATLQSSGLADALIYIQVTRGPAPSRNHPFPKGDVEPSVLIFVTPFDTESLEELKRRGGRAVLFDDIRWKRCDIKSINLLGNVLAAQAAADAKCDEAIFVNDDGSITEGAHASVFAVVDGQILTAPLAANVLPGITRQFITERATESGIPLREELLSRANLFDVDELFLTGTTVDVLGITTVDDRPIGDGQVGPVTRRLQQAYDAALRDDSAT